MNETIYVATFRHLETGYIVTRVFHDYEAYITWCREPFGIHTPTEDYVLKTSIAIYVGGDASVRIEDLDVS